MQTPEVLEDLLPEATDPAPALDVPEEIHGLISVFYLSPCGNEKNELSMQENNVITYIGGYIVRKLKPTVCESCYLKIASSLDLENSDHHFIAAKTFTQASEGLRVPSIALAKVLKEFEVDYCSEIDMCMTEIGVKKALATSFSKKVGLNDFTCNTCHLHLMVLHLYITIRLHHTIRKSNHHLADQKDRKIRKMLKFSNV